LVAGYYAGLWTCLWFLAKQGAGRRLNRGLVMRVALGVLAVGVWAVALGMIFK
jgi:hypothetical protein